MWKKIKPYVIGIAIAWAVGLISALLTRANMGIYDDIVRPALSPPMALFPAVWFVLYTLMGISSAMIFLEKDNDKDTGAALRIYGLQLVINFFWSIIFFNMRAYLFAFIWIMLLWVLIIAMIVQFRRLNATAAWLQVPYLLWVTFAAYLTLMVYLLNR